MAATVPETLLAPTTDPIRIPAPGKPWRVESVEVLVARKVEDMPPISPREVEECDVPGEYVPKSLSLPVPDTIPVVDMNSSMEEIVNVVKRACEMWDFFRVTKHGVSTKLMDRMIEVGKEFMALAPEQKVLYAAQSSRISQGYGNANIIQDDKVRYSRDYLFLFLQPSSIRDYAFWPSTPPDFREVMSEYGEQVKKLARTLLAAISMSLGLEAKYMERALGEDGGHQKALFNHYPACPQPQPTAGFQSHSDFGALTILLQEEGVVGLEVLHENEWVPVPPTQHSFVVNIGDQVEIISNGIYKSIEHRAVFNQEKSRLSIPLFHQPTPDALIAPAKELQEVGPIYHQVKFSDIEDTFNAYGVKGKRIVQSYIIQNQTIQGSLEAI